MKKRLTTSFILLFLAELIFNVSGYIVHAGLGRILGAAEYGRYSLIIGTVTIVSMLVARSVPSAMVKRISENADDWPVIHAIRSTAAQLQTWIILVAAIIFFCVTPLIATFLGDPTLTPLLQLTTLAVITFALSSFHVQYFNAVKWFGATALMKSARGVFRVVAILAGAALLMSASGALIGFILAPFFTFLFALTLYHIFLRRNHISHTPTKHPYPRKKILTYGAVFLLYTFFYELFMRFDLFMIKSLIGDDELVGVYSAAQVIILIPYQLILALTFILFPTVSTLTAEGKHAKIRILLRKVFLFLGTVLTLSSVGIYFLREWITTLIYGPDFAAAITFIPILLTGGAAITVFFVLVSIINGAGKPQVSAGISAGALTLSLLLNTLYTPLYGPTATALIFTTVATLMSITAFTILYTTILKIDTKSK